ncbi:MAG: hypothetical protein H0T73_00105, partial [Ardenticatenales bacterium]|nr:hypothetical protein [Ardenticatenales bacterium]
MLATCFIQRWDLYSFQRPDGRYTCVHRPLPIKHIEAHLRGEMTLGTYLLDPESQARFVVLDADDTETWQHLVQTARSLASRGVPGYLEQSRRGGHLWFFFARPVSGRTARAFGTGLIQASGLGTLELYPKQEALRDGPGSLIRLPFGRHRLTGRRYGFLTPAGERLAPTVRKQVAHLC